jgi:hypothetical protein
MAFSAAHENIFIYGCLHGSECGASNLFSWVYDDFTCCDALLGYGQGGYDLVKESRQRFLGNLDTPVKYIETSCSDVYSVFSRKSKSRRKTDISFKNAKILYVLSRIRGADLLNSNTFFSPNQTQDFIKSLLQEYENIDIKTHPKAEKN